MTRCPRCYKRVDADLLAVHVCLVAPAARIARYRPRAAPKPRRPQAVRVAGRTRDEYRETVASPHGTKRRYQHGPAAPGFERPSGGCGCPACKEFVRIDQRAVRERKRQRLAAAKAAAS